VNVAPPLAWLKNSSSTARTSERQLVAPGNRPIPFVCRRASPSDRSGRFVDPAFAYERIASAQGPLRPNDRAGFGTTARRVTAEDPPIPRLWPYDFASGSPRSARTIAAAVFVLVRSLARRCRNDALAELCAVALRRS
jgi:hypothetical protein